MSSVHPSIHLFTIHPISFIHTSSILLSSHLSIQSAIHPSIRLFTYIPKYKLSWFPTIKYPIYVFSHFSVTHKPWVWKLVGSLHDCYQGGSMLTWAYEHVLGHHIYTNIDGADPDLATTDAVSILFHTLLFIPTLIPHAAAANAEGVKWSFLSVYLFVCLCVICQKNE